MKKILALCCLFLLPGRVMAEEVAAAAGSTLIWSPAAEWNTGVKPTDISQSLDGKLVFVLAEDSQVHIYSAEGQKMGAVPAPQGTVAIDIAPMGERLYLMDGRGNYKALDISFTKNIDISGSPFLGKPEAPVAVVVFSDFQCPYCSRIKPVLDEVLKKNPETVKVVFKHFPLTSIHQEAEPAAKAAIAAQEQGKFWEMHDALFAASSSGSLNSASMEKAAADLGLNMEKFKADMSSETTKQKLEKDVSAARMAEVGGTPTLFVNGRKVNDPGTIQTMIEQELAKKQ